MWHATCSRRSCSTGVCRGGSIRRSSTRHGPRPSATWISPGAVTCATCRRSQSTRSPPATSMTRSRPSALKDGSWRVWVHIADVAAYVAPRSLVDREAYRRSTSVYVPDAVEPMLPQALSNNACSLVPAAPRLTVTVEMVVAEGGVTARLVLSVGHPLRRGPGLRPGRPDLRRHRVGGRAVGRSAGRGAGGGQRAEALRAGRGPGAAAPGRRGGVLDSPEPEFQFDRDGDVVGAELGRRRNPTGSSSI